MAKLLQKIEQMRFIVRYSPNFLWQDAQLSKEVHKNLIKQLRFLSDSPRHPSLQTHEVHGKTGKFGGKIFEAYVTMQYRFTWEYGPDKGEITLRNVDNHDECLQQP